MLGRANGPGHLDIVMELNRVGYQVIRVWEKPPYVPGARLWSFYRQVPLSELSLLTRELAMFFSSGIGLLRGLESVEEQGFTKQTSQAAADVAKALSQGRSFSQSLGLRSDVFRPVYIKLVHAGEVSGALDQILHRLSEHLERELELKKKLQSALAYPLLIFLVCLGLIAFLIFVLFPMFVSFFDGLNTKLPAITMSLVSVVNVLRHPLSIVALILTPIVLAKIWDVVRSKESMVLWFSNLLLDLPIIGALRRAVVLSRFCSTLSILLSSGIPQYTALTIVAEAMDNRSAELAIKTATSRIRDDGDSMAEAFGKEDLFPKMLVSLIYVGEEVGNLPSVLEMAYENFEMEVETTVSRLTVVMEPLILAVMGIIVGYVLLAVFLPVYSMLDGL